MMLSELKGLKGLGSQRSATWSAGSPEVTSSRLSPPTPPSPVLPSAAVECAEQAMQPADLEAASLDGFMWRELQLGPASSALHGLTATQHHACTILVTTPVSLPVSGHDDMSPPNSNEPHIGGEKKKKGPLPRLHEELCLVCGDRASGYHYNALTCEGCKGFFRRSMTKNIVYVCKYGQNCEIDMYMRRKCQECRLKKCLSIGMRPECVVPCPRGEENPKPKPPPRRRGSFHPALSEPTTPTGPDASDKRIRLSPEASQTPVVSGGDGDGDGDGGGSSSAPAVPSATDRRPKALTAEQNELINRLVGYQEAFESPTKEDMCLSAEQIYSPAADDSEEHFRRITEMTILTIKLIVEFSKRLTGFDCLSQDDQITLLKACSSEVMMLRCARRYDEDTESIVFANNYPYTRAAYQHAGLNPTTIEKNFKFCQKMSKMKVDNAEYALLTAIDIFSDRCMLQEPDKVERIQCIYVEALRAYVDHQRPQPTGVTFAKLLGVLTEVRQLGQLNTELCWSLKLQKKSLPLIFHEIWDVPR